ncbi:DNA-binding protein [Panus rudis PR-1116 ss-1]|nr:DNA-binding protein [Panus rudis PR-1116 ss-1]
MASDPPLSFNQAVRGVTEFIEVAIHTILYVRQVYPADVFVRRKKYNTPVFQSRHPALNQYISGATKAVSGELALGNVDKVIVVIKNKEEEPLERFIFAVQNMIQVEAFNKETSVQDAMTPSVLGHYFRSFLVKLTMLESQLSPYPLGDELSFSVLIELKDDKPPSATEGKNPPAWIPASTHHTTAGTSDRAELHMLRTVDTGIFSVSSAMSCPRYPLTHE